MLILAQVSNATNAIKIACDFVSIERIATTERLIQQFRHHRLNIGPNLGDDVLQLYHTLWYAWKWLAKQRDTTNAAAMSDAIRRLSFDVSEATANNYNLAGDHSYTAFHSNRPLMGSSDMDGSRPPVDETNCDDHILDAPSRPPNKAERRRAFNKEKRKRKVLGERPAISGHNARCPLCEGSFNRNGLICHL